MQRRNRLTKNYKFQRIIEKRKQIVNKNFVFYYQNNDEHLKVGISISKKMANAVKRNKYRRQIRNILDIIKPWSIKKDLVIIVRKPFFNLDFQKKIVAMRKTLERL